MNQFRYIISLYVLLSIFLVVIADSKASKKEVKKKEKTSYSWQNKVEKPVSDAIQAKDTGLSKSLISKDTKEAPKTVYKGKEPGKNRVLPRSFEGAPPMIPHDISDYLPIVRGNNSCTDCHLNPSRHWMMQNITLVPDNHLIVRKGNRVKNRRKLHPRKYNCTQCHAAQSHAKPLVENKFK